MIKTLIFDFFAVLVPDVYIIWLKENGLETQVPEIIKDHFHRSDRGEITELELYNYLANPVGKNADQLWAEIKNNFVPIDGMVDLITSLKEKYKIALCSNAPKGVVENFLKVWNMESLFDSIVVSSLIGVRKPDKEIFDVTLKSVGAKPEESLFIDDNKANIESAQEFGIKGIVFTDVESLKRDLFLAGII